MTTRLGIVRSLMLILLAAVGFATGWSLQTPDQVQAYNVCPYYCGSRYYSDVSWRDSTGWTGAKASTISSSGTAWHYASALNVYQYQDEGPVNGYVGVYDFGINSPPDTTWTYLNPEDPYEVVSAESYLNTAWTWYTDGTMSESLRRVDVRTITMHEMGHWFILGHDCSVDEAAVMCVRYVKKWSLAQDDKNGMAALY